MQLQTGRFASPCREKPDAAHPDEIDAVHLPRATVGGYKARPTADLLNRVSWDYRQIASTRRSPRGGEAAAARVAELEQELQEAKQAADGRRDFDELTRVVLATAQRAAREVREAARQEAETTLRKARGRGADIERQLANRRERALREIAALEATRSCLYEEIHSALESLKSAPRRAAAGGSARVDGPSRSSGTACSVGLSSRAVGGGSRASSGAPARRSGSMVQSCRAQSEGQIPPGVTKGW